MHLIIWITYLLTAPASTSSPPPTLNPAPETYRVVLEPNHRTVLSAQINGIPVVEVTKKIGDTFTKGELLIQFESDIFEGGVKKAEAALVKAETKLIAKQELFDDHSASLFELKEAISDKAAAESDLILAKKNLKASKIIAPYDGKVVRVLIEAYEIPHENSKDLMEIIDDKILVAKLFVPSRLLAMLKVGDPVQIKLDDTQEVITAHISRIGAAIEPSSGTLMIEAEIDNKESRFKAGMSGSLFFERKT